MVFSFVGPLMVIFVIEEEWFCQMYTFELLIEFGYSVLSCNWISIDYAFFLNWLPFDRLCFLSELVAFWFLLHFGLPIVLWPIQFIKLSLI